MVPVSLRLLPQSISDLTLVESSDLCKLFRRHFFAFVQQHFLTEHSFVRNDNSEPVTRKEKRRMMS